MTFDQADVTTCEQIGNHSSVVNLSQRFPIASGLRCAGTSLSTAACAINTTTGGACRNRPTNINELVNFLREDLNSDDQGQPISQTNTNSEENSANVPNMDEDVPVGQPRSNAIIPALGVSIPGLNFAPVTADDDHVYIPFLAQYISGVTRYAIGIAALVATIMVIFGGFLYLIGSTSGDVGRGKTMIQDALVGMLLIFSAYAILYVVNPETVNLRVLRMLNTDRVPFTVPQSAIPSQNVAMQNTAAASGGNQQSSNQTAPPPAQQPPANAVQQQGNVTTIKFNYQPNSNENWPPNQAQIMLPTRLANQSTRVHLYIYIHGHNSGRATSDNASYTRLVRGALQGVAGNMNIVVAGPHYLGASNPVFMPGFTINNFMNTLRRALQENPATRGFTIQDIVVSGHSAATCNGPRLLGDASIHPLQGQIGVVAYDGCAVGKTTNSGRYGSRNGTFLVNMDGMGFDPKYGQDGRPPHQVARGILSLDQQTCPGYIPAASLRTAENRSGRVVGCYSNQQGNVWMFMTRYGHGASVGHMTEWAFQHFYNR